jgi:hypothetical protein
VLLLCFFCFLVLGKGWGKGEDDRRRDRREGQRSTSLIMSRGTL